MEQPKLGKLCDSMTRRDAIHVAIAPVQAAMKLKPGTHVELDENGRAFSGKHNIGIVDPFLTEAVKSGQWFYLCLYPGTVTTLRHAWEHPKFVSEDEAVRDQRAESERWMRDYAISVRPYDEDPEKAYFNFMEALENGDHDSYGREIRRHDMDDSDSDAFKRHAEVLLGRPIDLDELNYVCGC